MSNKHILDLTVCLSQALDQNYDVVNMDAVLSIISALEGATITKEQLEATRLAKYINQLRRRTKSEQLARRAKSLLKNWREMVVWQTNASVQQQQQLLTARPPSSVTNVDQSVTLVEKKQHVDYLSSTALNHSVVLIPSEATSANLNCKKDAKVGRLSLPVMSLTDHSVGINMDIIQQKRKDFGKQPISFANLLTGIGNIEHPQIGNTEIQDQLNSCYSRKLSKHNECFSIHPAKPIETDQASNSNELPLSNISPEVINIQDSNSNPETNVSLPPTSSSYLSNSVIPAINLTPKIYKTKKEKKRKYRGHQQHESFYPTKASVQNDFGIIGFEESYSNHLKPGFGQEYEKFFSNTNNESHGIRPISGISEILSLSNSSMNVEIKQTNTDLNVENNSNSNTQEKTLSTSDLTFAGKFQSIGNSEMFGVLNSIKRDTSQSFVPFYSIGGNSNESTSNSRASRFELLDSNHENSRCKIKDNLRCHKKYDDWTSSATTQQQLLTPESLPTQVILPSKSATNSQILNATVERVVSGQIEQKIPKKRGRKKGSKGVDSVIAKETSLSTQMIMTTLGSKKVKTTKELYTEMQNRKLGVPSATSSPTLSNWLTNCQQLCTSRPNSSCSEPSLNSPRTSDACSTNATVSTVATISTPETNVYNNSFHDEVDDSYSDDNTSEASHDSSTQTLLGCKQLAEIAAKKPLSFESVEKQINELLLHMPPVKPINKIVCECSIDVVPCTCKVIEVTRFKDSPVALNSMNENECKIETAEHKTVVSINMNQLTMTSKSATQQIKQKSDSTLRPEQKKKSIFDVDFEDDEDPLQIFVAEAAAKHCFILEDNEDNKLQQKATEPDLETMLTVHKSPQLQCDINIANFQINEDSNCLAKDRYEIQTQKVNQFHVKALHNCFIPNVNGNWDNAEALHTGVLTYSKESDEQTPDNFSKNVVPQYGSLNNEYIPKDLSHIKFTDDFKPRKKTFKKRQHYVAFLGVGRSRRVKEFVSQMPKDFERTKVNSLGNKQIHMKSNQYKIVTYPGFKSEIKKHNLNNININDLREKIINKSCTAKGEISKAKCDSSDKSKNINICNNSIESRKFRDIRIHVDDDISVETSKNIPTPKNNDSVNRFLLTLASLPKVLQSNPFEIQNDQNINNMLTSSNIILNDENKSAKNATAATLIKNVDNHRSSSCSNSSLQETQHSINLKLRRHRLFQQQYENQDSSASDFKSCRKRRYKRCKKIKKQSLIDKRSRSIKRIKIAINDNIATQRQISTGSSNTSTDMDDEEDDGYFHSAGRRNSLVADASDEHNILNENFDEEAYVDDNIEDDEDDDYTGDFHEVVTRDLSLTSTGNSHIVLTIKKTPSKTNSPSDSIILVNQHDLPSVTATKDHAKEMARLISTVENKDTHKKQMMVQNPDISSKECGSNISKANLKISTKFQNNENVVEDKVNPTLNNLLPHRLKKRYIKRRRKKIESSFSAHNSQKLHRQLFFHYELLSSNFSDKHKISSCSSSCGEGSAYASVTDNELENKGNSEITSLNTLQTLSNENVYLSIFNDPKCSSYYSDSFCSSSDSSHTADNASLSSLSCPINKVKQKVSFEIGNNETVYKYESLKGCNVEIDADDAQHKNVIENNTMLSIANNGFLKSFNNIYLTSEQDEQKQKTLASNFVNDKLQFNEQITNLVDTNIAYTENLKKDKIQHQELLFENCDDYNNIYNNNNSKFHNSNKGFHQIVKSRNNISGNNNENIANAVSGNNYVNNDTQKSHFPFFSSSSSTIRKLSPQKEYLTGLRAVDEDVDDEDGNNCAHIQQFKEWHQVLQLRSYNDELLTVLPYVVLE